MIRRPIRLLRILRSTLLSLVAIAAIGLALLTSSSAIQLLAWLGNWMVPGLQIGLVDGNLQRGLFVQQLTYQHGSWQVRVDGAYVDINLWCLPNACINQLRLDSVHVQQTDVTPPSADNQAVTTQLAPSDASSPLPSSPVTLPPIRLHTLAIGRVWLQSTQQNIELVGLTSAANIQGSTIELLPTHVGYLQVQTGATKQPSAMPLEQLALEQILTFWPELSISAPRFAIASMRLNDEPFQQLDSTLTLNHDSFAVSLDSLHYQEYQAQAHATLSRQGALQAQVSITSQAQQLELQADGDLNKLHLQIMHQAKQATALMPIAGQINADVMLGLAWPFPVTGSLQTDQLTVTVEPNSPLQLQKLHLDIDGSIEQLTLQSQGELKADALVEHLPQVPFKITSHWQANQDLHLKAAFELLSGQLEVEGALTSQQFQGKVAAKQLQPGLLWPDYPGIVSGSSEITVNTQPMLKVQLAKQQWQGDIRSMPLQLQGDIALQKQVDAWQLYTKNLALIHGPNSITIDGHLDTAWQLQAQIQVADLSQTLVQWQGQIEGQIQLAGERLTPDVNFQLQGQGIRWLEHFRLKQLQFNGRLPRLGTAASSLQLTIDHFILPEQKLERLDWQTQGTLASHQSHLLIQSPILQATSVFDASLTNGLWRGDFSEVQLKSDFGFWQLEQPWQLQLDLKKQQLQLGQSCWTDAQARGCIESSGWLNTQQGQVQIRGEHFPLQNLDWLLPEKLGLQGLGQGQVALRWQQGRFEQIEYQLTTEQGALKYLGYSPVAFSWRSASVQGQLNQGTLSNQLQLQVADQQQLALDLAISDLGKAVPILQGNLQVQQLDLAFLRPLWNEFTQFNGKLDGALRLSGALAQPDIYGELRMHQLQLTGQQAPIELVDSAVALVFEGRQARLQADLQAPEGKINLSGMSSWLQTDAWFTQLQFSAEHLTVHTRYGGGELAPNLQLLADPKQAKLSGVVQVLAGDLRFNEIPENAVPISTDEVFLQQQNTKDAQGIPWLADVRLSLAPKVKLAAFGLKTRLAGDLRLRYNATGPQLHGQVQLLDGSFRAYGQDLQLSRGRLTFNGLPEQPLLNIEAIRNPEKTEDNVTAGLRVTGSADNPSVEVFSKPAKPQANALAYLLLGRDLGSSPGDGAMTTGLIGLGIASSGQFVGKFGEAVGLSDLSLDTSGAGDQSKVTVSGYLSPRLQVKYGVGIFNQFGEFSLRYRIIQQLYLEAVRGLNNSVDVLYKVQFD